VKFYISADIEGVTGICNWNETEKGTGDYREYANQMTLEVKAACDAIIKAFPEEKVEILVKDAHDSARNIDPRKLPDIVKLYRGWSGDPRLMMDGLDETFDGVIYIGYHSNGFSGNNPLSHTLSTDINYIKINGDYASEFLINGYTASLYNVPSIFVSGDMGLCEDAMGIIPTIDTVPVNQGIGAASISINPDMAIELIEKNVMESVINIQNKKLLAMPEYFEVEICYKKHTTAYRKSFYPGCELIDSNTIKFQSENYYEVLRAFMFIA
jgi:D-amino peptidase